MIILDAPYVSDFLKETIEKNQFLTLNNIMSEEKRLDNNCLLNSFDFAEHLKKNSNTLVYTNSENAYGWIAENLSFTGLPEKIELFKNKARFRDFTKKLYPNLFYLEVDTNHLDKVDFNALPSPFIIKPAVGFFSLGVYKVSDEQQWEETKKMIHQNIEEIESLYPKEVLNTSTFIIEECIEGEEFAFDAYYDENGEPVILNILNHVFSSGEDVSDRVYLSSRQIIEKRKGPFESFLSTIGAMAELKNFPLHVEVRVDKNDTLVPIEVNPLRFGGLCTTADMTYYSYGFNPYEFFFQQKKPDWNAILKNREGKLYSLIVLDNTTGENVQNIKRFDYEKLKMRFKNPLELRKMDYKTFNVFGFVFTETDESNYSELESILKSDLREFVEICEQGEQ